MMKQLLFGLLLVICVTATKSVQAYTVLFIGNSYTGYSEPTLRKFAELNPHGEDHLEFEFVGGISLMEHARREQTLVKLRSRRWDYVVLQDHSQQALRNRPAFEAGIESLVTRIRLAGAEPVLFATWARRNASLYEQHQTQVSAAYRQVAERLGIAVISVGDVWLQLYRETPEIHNALFEADGIHPTSVGTLSVAASVYRVFYGGTLEWVPITTNNETELRVIRAVITVNQPLKH